MRREDRMVVVGNEGRGVGVVANVPTDDSGGGDELSVAQSSWDERSSRGKGRWPDPKSNLKRP